MFSLPNRFVRILPEVAETIRWVSETSSFLSISPASGPGRDPVPEVAAIFVSSKECHDSGESLENPTAASVSVERYRSSRAKAVLRSDIHSTAGCEDNGLRCLRAIIIRYLMDSWSDTMDPGSVDLSAQGG